MPKFEYHFVTFKPVPAKQSELHVYSINGKVDNGLYGGTTPHISQYANELGDQGWELIFYEPVAQSSDVRVVFKRSKE